jgi:prepilin-type N-terminal cleavage/methylation domain-containing protein
MSRAEVSTRSRRRGFTLVEVMIGATLGSIVLAGVLSAYTMLLRSGVSASNFAMMESQARRTFEQLGMDVRMASGISSTTTGGVVTAVTLTVPNYYSANSNQVTYAFDSTNKWLYMVPGDGSAYVVPGAGTVPSGELILIRNVTAVVFNRYDQSSAATTSDSSTRHIQAAISVARSAARNTYGRITTAGTAVYGTQSDTILSAAFTMRN